MLSFFATSQGIVFMSAVTLVFIFGAFAYFIWKVMKLSNHKPKAGEKSW